MLCSIAQRQTTDVVMSEQLHANFSYTVNAKTAETGNRSAAGHVPAANSIIILRMKFLLTMAVINLCGSGFTLTTIRRMSRLWTKTNFIFASMLVADCITGVFMFWYIHLYSLLCMSLTTIASITW